jgi:ribonuclease P protein component
MLKKKERLTRKEFDRSFSIGKRLHGAFVQLIFAPSETFHCSVVVGKKISKKAVERNKLRRRTYAVAYLYHKAHDIQKTFIIVLKPPARTAKPAALREEVLELLHKASRA